MSGYNDPEMLKAAIELAQSFSRAKGGGNNRAGGSGLGGRKENFEPHQLKQHSRYGQVTAQPRQTFTPSVPSVRPLAPPPSRRNYGASGDFATRRGASRPVIGNLGRDFLISSGVKAESETPKNQKLTTGISVPVAGQESQKGSLADKNSNGGTTKPEPLSTPPRSSGNGQLENILDAFYAIIDKKPSIGQEIDTLAEALSKADLNDPGTPTPDTPPVKENVRASSRQCNCQEFDEQGKHEKTCPRHTAQEKKAKDVDETQNNVEMKASEVKVNNEKVTDAESNDAKSNDIKAAPQIADVDVDGDIDVDVDVEPSSGPAYTHSRKLSPVAPVFVPRSNQDLGQAMDTNGENSPSIKKSTKGLSASMWA